MAGNGDRRKPVPAQDLLPARHALLRRQLGHHAVVHHPVSRSQDRRGIVAIANMPAAQLEKFYGSKEAAQIPSTWVRVPRLQHPRQQALFTLAHWAMAYGNDGVDEAAYSVTDGERICSMAIGWNFGDGHMHNEQLIAALQRRCHFEPGEVRESAARRPAVAPPDSALPTGRPGHGEFERAGSTSPTWWSGQPWDDDVPVHIEARTGPL